MNPQPGHADIPAVIGGRGGWGGREKGEWMDGRGRKGKGWVVEGRVGGDVEVV